MKASTRKRSTAKTYAHAALSGFLTVLSAGSVCLALACHGGKLVGIENAEVLSGSMEPAITTGSLAYFNTNVDPANLQAGQVIAFLAANNTQVIHRVVKNDPSSQQLVTKGDANKAADPAPVSYRDVKGVIVGSVPHLGRVINGIHETLQGLLPPSVAAALQAPSPSS